MELIKLWDVVQGQSIHNWSSFGPQEPCAKGGGGQKTVIYHIDCLPSSSSLSQKKKKKKFSPYVPRQMHLYTYVFVER